jgi:hypothetical protein
VVVLDGHGRRSVAVAECGVGCLRNVCICPMNCASAKEKQSGPLPVFMVKTERLALRRLQLREGHSTSDGSRRITRTRHRASSSC